MILQQNVRHFDRIVMWIPNPLDYLFCLLNGIAGFEFYICNSISKKNNLKTIRFHKTECGVDFLLNVLISDDVKMEYMKRETFNSDYFEVVFFKKANGKLVLNHQQMEISDNNIVFISPYQKRQWLFDDRDIEFTTLVFQEEFVNDFFADKLFTYRLLYFYQLEFPLSLAVPEVVMLRFQSLLSEIKQELVATKADVYTLFAPCSITFYNRLIASMPRAIIFRWKKQKITSLTSSAGCLRSI